MDTNQNATEQQPRTFTPSELGMLAHLYRGEIYRSTVWRTRLDTTTNWAVVTLGVALSISYSSPDASPLPLVLVGVLIMFFVVLEARRYRYFNVWRARARWIERYIMAPILQDGNLRTEKGWQNILARDYLQPEYHIDFMTSLGRRIRRNYLWILIIQTASYVGKLTVHPAVIGSVDELWARAAIGPIPGKLVMVTGVVYIVTWAGIGIATLRIDNARHRGRSAADAMG